MFYCLFCYLVVCFVFGDLFYFLLIWVDFSWCVCMLLFV